MVRLGNFTHTAQHFLNLQSDGDNQHMRASQIMISACVEHGIYLDYVLRSQENLGR
jgi:hypothetical protein